MNKHKGAILAAVALIAAIIVAGFYYLSRTPKTGPGPGGADENTPGSSAGPQGAAESRFPKGKGKVRAAAPPKDRPGPLLSPTATRKPYDIGVKVDRRMTHTPGGKHIFNEAVEIARQLHSSNTSPDEDVSHLNEILSFYRMVFHENPVAGDNQSVMAALMGDNERGIVVFPSDHPSLDATGQLIDRWRTPYYFHALSGKQMEIISLGPDQKLGTRDDIIYTERDRDDFFRGVTTTDIEP